MSIMNRPSDGLPSLVVALWRAVRHLGALESGELLSWVCPDSLKAGLSEPEKAQQTLTRWTQLGLFTEQDGAVHLAHPFGDIPDQGLLVELRAAMRRLVLLPENNIDFLKSEPAGAADFTVALSWSFCQDIYSYPGGSIDDIQAKEADQSLPDTPVMFSNNTRWAGFKNWAVFLGFAQQMRGSQLVLDPTSAVRDALPSVFNEAQEVTQSVLVNRVGKHLPVLDSGVMRQKIPEHFGKGFRPPETSDISPALTRALLTLEELGAIEIPPAASDAPRRQMLGPAFEPIREVTHFRRTA